MGDFHIQLVTINIQRFTDLILKLRKMFLLKERERSRYEVISSYDNVTILVSSLSFINFFHLL